MIPLPIYLFLLVELLFVGWIDYKTEKISNFWPIINIAFYSLFLLFIPQFYLFNLDTFLYPIVFLVVGFGLYAVRIVGAGDIKYLFSFFLLVPLKYQDTFFSFLLISTLAIGIFLFLYNTFRGFAKIKEALRFKNVAYIHKVYGKKFAYSPIIGFAWVWFGWSFVF